MVFGGAGHLVPGVTVLWKCGSWIPGRGFLETPSDSGDSRQEATDSHVTFASEVAELSLKR